MDTIYRQASQVLIYLGETDASSNDVMDYISERKISTDTALQIVIEFFERRGWFNRVWVLQEVALADCALAVCGSRCVPWACFPAWWARNAASLEGRLEPPPTLSYDPAVIKRSSLLQQLHDTRHSRATHPADKIYALVGLLSPEDRLGVLVDYSQSTATIYIHVAVSIISRHASLRLLSGMLEHGVLGDRDAELPSWVPDWSIIPSTASLGLSNIFLEPYDAGGKPACDVRIHTKRADGPILECLGITFGTVAYLGQSCPVGGSGEEISEILNQWNGLIIKHGGAIESIGASQKAIFYSGGHFFPVAPASRHLWPTILAQASSTLELTPDEIRMKEARPVRLDALKFCRGRKFFITQGGSIGLAPIDSSPGDIIAVLLGAPVPHLLRKRSDGLYTFIGECYVYGIMNGEALAHLGERLKSLGHRCRPFLESRSNSPLQVFKIR